MRARSREGHEVHEGDGARDMREAGSRGVCEVRKTATWVRPQGEEAVRQRGARGREMKRG